MARLPIPGADDGQWGNILNDFLKTGHRDDGANKNNFEVVNVKDFGAIGNGVSDDTASITAAIAAVTANEQGGKVYLPVGIYLVTGIIVPSEVILIGSGQESTMIYSNTNGTIVQIGTGTTDCYGTGLRDLTIQGNSGVNQIGLLLNGRSTTSGIWHCHFRNIKVHNCGAVLIKCTYSWLNEFYQVVAAPGPQVGRCLDIDVNCNILIFRDCKFCYSSANIAMLVKGKGHLFDGCQIEDNSSTSGILVLGDGTDAAENVKVRNCWFEDNQYGDVIKIGGNSNTTITIDGCIFSGAGVNLPAYYINVLAGKSHCITSNTFRNNVGTAFITLGAFQSRAFIAYNRALNGTSTRIENPTNGLPIFLEAFDDAGYDKPIFYNQVDAYDASFRAQRIDPADVAYIAKTVADANNRLTISANGKIEFGPGNTVVDTNLYRSAPNMLAMGTGDSFKIDCKWDGGLFWLGNSALWADNSGILRIKNGAPTSDTDGTIIGTQS